MLVQHPDSKLWDAVDIIVGLGRYRSYHVKFPSGSVLRRNRRFLRRRLIVADSVVPASPPTETPDKDADNAAFTTTDGPVNAIALGYASRAFGAMPKI